ncbi:5-(carboxyamino)imidazole ribonucleotide synthase [Lewinellaceae bacterium SD302]|nr:5-(carboxyamino)imidazole ribonucleotide synthase [Lewinellaceae bacterium SD302]
MQKTLGILGGGQLGKMLCQAASVWHQPIHVLDDSADFPAAPYATKFVAGSFRDEADVLAFGRSVDVLTIEIEHIDTKALRQLQSEGIEVYPQPEVIDTIKDKGLQKRFYRQHELPTADFELFDDKDHVIEAVNEGRWPYPFVQKVRTGGYDGRGVAVIRNEADLEEKLLEGPSLLEKLADIDKELAAVVARGVDGSIRVFPCVEMEFHPTANLVEYLLCPAAIPGDLQREVSELARTTAEAYGIVGLLAVELFLNKDGSLWINEVAPRPHNSGHHTIEACVTSQYEQHLRAVLGLPLGTTDLIRPAAMANILGAAGHTGPAIYKNLDQVLEIPGLYPHLYGKAITKPFRKMGHLTAIGDTVQEARARAERAKALLSVESDATEG